MKFNNIEIFEKWLKSVLKPEYAKYVENSIDEWLDDVDGKYGETGTPIFEISKYATKSGVPECYSYDVIQIEDIDGNFETTYIL